MLYLGTMFAPVQDRGGVGKGFTHKIGDVVSISTPLLGTLTNRVKLSTECPPWTYGASHLFRDLIRAGLVACISQERDIEVVAELDRPGPVLPTISSLRPDVAVIDDCRNYRDKGSVPDDFPGCASGHALLPTETNRRSFDRLHRTIRRVPHECQQRAEHLFVDGHEGGGRPGPRSW